METTSINCPHCGNLIDVNEILYNEMHQHVSQEFTAKMSGEKKELEQRTLTLEKEKAELQQLKSEIDVAIAAGINKKLPAERAKYEKQIRDQITAEKSEELKSYVEQLDEKTKEVKAMNRLKAENQKLQREKSEMKEKIEAEAEEKITALLEQTRRKITKDQEEKSELKIIEKEQIIEQLRKQLKEATRKAEQGSVQLQGEAMEVNLEDYLRKNFPQDVIEEIKKGVKGADCLQRINAKVDDVVGSIYYETKRTKEFKNSWIGKFKADMQARNATFGALVTEVLPDGADRMLLRDGIWICSLDEAKGLCYVLREAAILLHHSQSAQQDKGSKMELLYQYMTSNEFRRQVETIVEGFSEMQDALISERRAMESIWRQREKQIQKVLLNTTHIYSSVKGIAGNVIGSIKLLELNSNDNPKKN